MGQQHGDLIAAHSEADIFFVTRCETLKWITAEAEVWLINGLFFVDFSELI